MTFPSEIPKNIFSLLADIDEDGFKAGISEEKDEKWKKERVFWRRLRAGRHAYYDAKWKSICDELAKLEKADA